MHAEVDCSISGDCLSRGWETLAAAVSRRLRSAQSKRERRYRLESLKGGSIPVRLASARSRSCQGSQAPPFACPSAGEGDHPGGHAVCGRMTMPHGGLYGDRRAVVRRTLGSPRLRATLTLISSPFRASAISTHPKQALPLEQVKVILELRGQLALTFQQAP
jgi:hypothetical protein